MGQIELQQYLPFTVLKLKEIDEDKLKAFRKVATVLTVYGIETENYISQIESIKDSCNSTYRLRY